VHACKTYPNFAAAGGLFLTQFLLHAPDPHPGNIAVDAVGGGRLIYYDFGEALLLAPHVQRYHTITDHARGGMLKRWTRGAVGRQA
jgi:hypothetical protein